MFAEIIDRDPDVLASVRQHLLALLASHPGSYIQMQWSQLLRRPWQEVREIMLAEDERGRLLRAESPFVSFLV
jgi:hypothetical protein